MIHIRDIPPEDACLVGATGFVGSNLARASPRYVIQAGPAAAVLPLFLAGWLWRRLRPTTGLA